MSRALDRLFDRLLCRFGRHAWRVDSYSLADRWWVWQCRRLGCGRYMCERTEEATGVRDQRS